MALTAKQEAFCQNILDGCTQTEAYRRSYECANMDDKTVNNEGYKLMNNRDIAARIQQLREQLAERLLFPRIERLQILKEIAQEGDKNSDRINAVKVFGDLVGDNATQKLEIEHSGTIDTKSNDEITREAQEIAARLNG